MNSDVKFIKGQWHSIVYNEDGDIIFEAKYNPNKYGIYAKMLAERSTRTLIFYRNIIVEKDNYNILRLITRKGKITDVLIDKEHTKLISSKSWLVHHDKYIIYKDNKETHLLLGRWLYTQLNSIGYNDNKNYHVFYKNGNSFDCRLENLVYEPAQSTTYKYYIKNSESGYVGVTKRGNSWVASWHDGGSKHQLSFSIKRYGNTKAKALAIATRIEKEKMGD